jgi:5-methylcytosine-specific restriction enzyme subunit McrC
LTKPVRLRVPEYGRLDLPAARAQEWQRKLLSATAHVPFDVFRHRRQFFTAAGAVGLVDIGDLQVEILPKAGLVDDDPSPQASALLLMRLLAVSGLTARTFAHPAYVSKTGHNLVESMARAFADRLSAELTAGPPRRYSERMEWSSVIRGRIQGAEQRRRDYLKQVAVPVRYAPLQQDNDLSRALVAAAHHVARGTRSSRTWSILQTSLAQVNQVARQPLSISLVNRVVLNRFEERWMSLLGFARLLAGSFQPLPVRGGSIHAMSLVFPVNDLFESLLRCRLSVALGGSGIALRRRAGSRYVLRSLEDGRTLVRIRPDFVFVRTGDPNQVLLAGDAKWKVLGPPGNLGLSETDVYQLLTYMLRHRVSQGVLFFPLRPWMVQNAVRSWTHRFTVADGKDSRVTLIGVDVEELVAQSQSLRQAAERRLRDALVGVTS